ncbi:hypothetical protein FHR84_002893 [Actinopolyspora biskrensis]|uniref:Uncharacterized protein n=1 Tax=Actinopolyspora biskrensis TaxID=1470178 RepID=A0A852Z2R4_9ACTN|nr:hypothetical protein [Actinopolyspora biskrensis]
MLGSGGHFLPRSKYCSTTFTELRHVRAEHQRGAHLAELGIDETDSIEVLGDWSTPGGLDVRPPRGRGQHAHPAEVGPRLPHLDQARRRAAVGVGLGAVVLARVGGEGPPGVLAGLGVGGAGRSVDVESR